VEQLKAFIEKVNSDKELLEKVDALGAKGANNDELISLAAECGFTITADELDEKKKSLVLDEEQLQEVVGGTGGGSADKCWFTPTGRTKTEKMFGEDIPFAECGSTCWQINTCWCYKRQYADRGICVDKWHELEYWDTLWPYQLTNHEKKQPPSYNE